ncbi:GLPGLI family protein [Tenacibaculum sp. UWU-22]|uniref:GLPGLI family protein n=1 Tax=Tenacibaculum sp. UWU-22 TaxID=3234187 RepID=UPI0034DB1800
MKHLLTSFLLCISITVFAQKNFQGRATYKSKTSIDLANFGRGDMSEQRKKEIMERMKSMLEKTYILNFDKTTSLYKEEEKLETPGQQQRGFRFRGLSGGGVEYKNISENKLIESTEFFGKNFLISETAEPPHWELTSETKQIGQYTCYKATMTKKADEINMMRMPRPRKKDDKSKEDAQAKNASEQVEEPKEIQVTAWFTPQIPVNNGPGEYWGLPGLILEVNADRTTILCTEVVLNPSEKIEINEPTKGKKVTRQEFNEIAKKKIEEMREMFRNGRGRSGRGFH